MSDKRRGNIATLDNILMGLAPSQQEALLARQSPETQRAISSYRQVSEDTPGAVTYEAEVAGRKAKRTVAPPSKTARRIQSVQSFFQSLGESFKGIANGGTRRIERIPTLGDIGVPLTVLLVLFFAIMPTKGADGKIHTRLGWLWLTIINQAHVIEPASATATTTPILDSSGNVIGASGDFGVTPLSVGTLTNPLQVAVVGTGTGGGTPTGTGTTPAAQGITATIPPGTAKGGGATGGGANANVYGGTQSGRYGDMLFKLENEGY